MGHHYLVIGSGIAGGLICQELLKDASNRITLFEAGPSIKMRDYRTWLDLVTTGTAPYDPYLDAVQDYENIGPQDLILRNSRVFARGGSTLHWDGCCPRLTPEDFFKKSACGKGMDWPFGYSDLEPYYEEAEKIIGVSGDAKRSHVVRANPFPLPALQPNIFDHQMKSACDELGWKSEQIPMARNVVSINGRPACQMNGTCKYCPIGGRFTGDQLSENFHSESCISLIRGIATRFILRNTHEVAGLEYFESESGVRKRIEGERIILAAGSLESAKMLLASTSEQWPKGLGNASGHLGRHLTAHPLLKLRIGRKSNPEHLHSELYFPTWCSREFDSPKMQREGKMIIFPFGGPAVDISTLIAEGKTLQQVDTAVSGPSELLLAALVEMQEGENSRIELAAGKTSLGLPRTRLFFEWEEQSLKTIRSYQYILEQLSRKMGWEPLHFQIDQSTQDRIAVRADHVTGLCRMAKNETDGVVDPNLLVHGLDNLWICSNAVFPSPGVANPTLTLSALALRLGAHLRSPQN